MKHYAIGVKRWLHDEFYLEPIVKVSYTKMEDVCDCIYMLTTHLIFLWWRFVSQLVRGVGPAPKHAQHKCNCRYTNIFYLIVISINIELLLTLILIVLDHHFNLSENITFRWFMKFYKFSGKPISICDIYF